MGCCGQEYKAVPDREFHLLTARKFEKEIYGGTSPLFERLSLPPRAQEDPAFPIYMVIEEPEGILSAVLYFGGN